MRTEGVERERGGEERQRGEGLWRPPASAPVCVNQQIAHGCNEVENKKNIKVSK